MKHHDINRELTAAIKRQKGDKWAVESYVTKIRKWVPVQISLGIFAIFLLFIYFGINAVIKTLLDWIIGITIATLVVTHLVSKYKY